MSGAIVHITVDGVSIPARMGQSVLQACDEAGIYIPRLCYHPDLEPGGQCRLCTCKMNGRHGAACYTHVADGMIVENNTPELNADRRTIVELLFIEGNHFCPSCEMSGDCKLQAMAYRLGLDAVTLPYLWIPRELDASHPDFYLDRNRCILCGLCVRASRDVDGKTVFSMEGRGIDQRLAVDSPAGLGGTQFQVGDKAAEVCPVACIVRKENAFRKPIGQRLYDREPIGSDIEKRRKDGQS
jgi:[NiFe] hydrogenase diaphorase moiety small subunit